MIRVLVADDSPTSRALLVHLLKSDAAIQVVGEASDGAQAVVLARRLHPDVITMDILMPGMNGVEATREIMAHAPTRIVIVSSVVRQEPVQLALDALQAGAVMVLGKPDDPDEEAFEQQRAELLTMVKAMAQVKVVRRRSASVAPTSTVLVDRCIEVVAMAASTGGPEAVRQILAALPAPFPAPILLVQHIARGFTAGFARWLDRSVPSRVIVAEHGQRIESGTVYVAPDDLHLGLGTGRRIVLSRGAPIGNLRPSANHLFQSTAHLGPRLAAVILTGMGRDGISGLAAVRNAGGRIVAQDEATSVVYGMPGEARAANLVDVVLPLQGIARQLTQWCGAG